MLALLLVLLHAVAPLSARIDAVMRPLARKDAPGCAVAVVASARVIYAKGYGMADLERGVPITPDTVFDIGSTSKQFTATAVLLLVADGKLGLADHLRARLPELPAWADPITLRHMLHHESGIRDYIGILAGGGAHEEDFTTSRDALAALVRQRGVIFPPGARFEYSNSNYFLLAQVVERVSKTSLAELLAARVFTPLGMTRTHVHDDHTRLVPGRAIGYAARDGGGWQLEMSNWDQTGDGAVFTTVLDLARWDANFYQPKVGGRALLEGLQERGRLASGEPTDYAAGLLLGTHRGLPTVSHDGAWAGYRAELLRFPTQRTSVIVLCNFAGANPSRLAFDIADVVLEKQLAPEAAAATAATPASAPAQLTAGERDAWVGTYRETHDGRVLHIDRDGNRLVSRGGTRRLRLEPIDRSTFRLAASPQVAFSFSGAPPRRHLRIGADQDYAEAPSFAPTTADLAAYAGHYHSDELQADWTITVEKDELHLRARAPDDDDDDDALAPETTDEFSGDGVAMAFTRDAHGVTGFVIADGGLQGIRFERR